MNVTRNVIKDLLPLYQEGEASQDSRLLVEQFLESDDELRGQLAASSTIEWRRTKIRPEIDDALATLEKTKSALARQKRLQVFAILFTLAPLSFAFQDGRLKYLLLRDAPLSLIPLWGAAIVLWAFYRRSRRSGQTL